MQSNFIKSSVQQFKYYKELGEKTFEKLSDSDIHWQFNTESNNISVIVKHIVGNQLSRWTNFLTEDGEKDWRNRDTEFEDSYSSKKEMIIAWNKGWECLFSALYSLNKNDLGEIIYIRNQEHTLIEAINRQLCHYSYHVGQLVYIARMIQNTNWQSLSIPKNQSSTYNETKFSQDKS